MAAARRGLGLSISKTTSTPYKQRTENHPHRGSMSAYSRALPVQPVQADSDTNKSLKHYAWMLLCILATLVGVVSLRYLLPHIPFAIPNSNIVLRRPWLVTHAGAASIALIVGPWQFVKRLRTARKRLHRQIGWIYLIAVLIGWIASIPVSLHAQAGHVSQAGFLSLGAAWITTTSLALIAAVNRQFEKHGRWMIRSYAVTAAAITLRIMLPISLVLGVPFKYGYPLIAWACWVLNLCCAEYLLNTHSKVSLKRQQMHLTAPV